MSELLPPMMVQGRNETVFFAGGSPPFADNTISTA